MEALKSLPVVVSHCLPGNSCSSVSDSCKVQTAARGVLVSSYRGVSIRSKRNTVGGKKSSRGGCAVSVSAAANAVGNAVGSLDMSDLVTARKEILRLEQEAQGFSITEIGTSPPSEWHSATVTKVEEVASGVRCITLTAECSRELVKLDQAYRQPGQLAQVKVGEEVTEVSSSSPPFSEKINFPVLYKIRGDIPAGSTKLPAYSLSAKAPLDLHVTEADSPVVFNLKEGDEVALGPWKGTGLDLRPILFLTRYSTIILFAQGKGIAVARAIVEASDGDAGSLNLGLRRDVRVYYSAPKPSLLAYKDLYSKWEENEILKVRTVVESSDGENWNGNQGNLTSLWDEDDIEYDPITTGVVVAVESSKREEVTSLLAEAGIPDSQIVLWDV